jgi:tetratricopeptide (TPR) repeat protein
MIRRLTGGAVLALAACATASAPAVVTPIATLSSSGEVTKESLLALNSICSAEDATATARTRDIELVSGMGTGGFKVDTVSKEAQDWFDYGLALSHAFYHEDAKRAMKKSVEADPSCSLCAWGEAWAWGPTINYSINEEQRAVALASAERAKSLVKPGDDKTGRLADAAVARYQKDAKDGEKAFGDAMKAIAETYPQDLEIASLASHALLMSSDFGDKARLAQAIALMERVLKERPDDTGAIHYYIHATEWDGRAEDAIPYAERLGKLAPAASHLVHMPAHTFFRAGRYQDAAVVNAQAIAADMDWLEAGGDRRFPMSFDWMSPDLPPYYAHNLTFGLAGALMSGDAQLALKYAEHAEKAYPANLPEKTRNGVVPRSWVALARYAPDRALALPAIGNDPAFAAYRAYARGEALLIKGDAAGARLELKALRKVKAPDDEAEVTIAQRVLEARIAMAEGDIKKATKLFDRAAKLQEKELNDWMDPPAWWYPVRRSVAAAHLRAGDFAKAEAEAKKSLAVWKHDPLALWVLGKAQIGAGRASEGEATLAEARKIWRGDFASITMDAI